MSKSESDRDHIQTTVASVRTRVETTSVADRSQYERRYLRRVDAQKERVVTMRCPICDLPRDMWEEQRTSAHYRRDDHTWAALDAAAHRRTGGAKRVMADGGNDGE